MLNIFNEDKRAISLDSYTKGLTVTFQASMDGDILRIFQDGEKVGQIVLDNWTLKQKR